MKIRLAFLVSLILCFLPAHFSRPVWANKPNTTYFFIEIETKVYRKGVEISSANPEERRWYFSNVVEMPQDVPSYLLIKQKVMPYNYRDKEQPNYGAK